jgi:hypothetical protein
VVADLDDQDDQFFVSNRADDSIVAFSDTIQIVFAGQFLDTLPLFTGDEAPAL